MTYDQLQDWELKITKTPIPKLSEAFDILKVREAPFIINVEVKDSKPNIVHKILDLSKEMGILDQVFISSFHCLHEVHCGTYNPPQPFGFIRDFTQNLNMEMMMSRKVIPGDEFIINFENILFDFNYIAPLVKRLKDKGYKWGIWYPNGSEQENSETMIKII